MTKLRYDRVIDEYYQWVDRNEDKPHRCPYCHIISDRARSDNGYGPLTIMTCRWCRVQWRTYTRAKRYNMGTKAVMKKIRAELNRK